MLNKSKSLNGESVISCVFTGNFKAFEAPQRIPIKPLTLIYGPNSAGKSSLIQSLVFAREAMRTGALDLFTTESGGQAIDLGGFRQFIHRRDAKLRLTWGAEMYPSSLVQIRPYLSAYLPKDQAIQMTLSVGLALDDYGQPVSGTEPEVVRCEWKCGEDILLRMNREGSDTLSLTDINSSHPILHKYFEGKNPQFTHDHTPESDAEEIQQLIELIFGLKVELNGLIPTKLEQGDLIPEAQSLAKLLSDLLEVSCSVIRKDLSKLQYLGPLRSFPSRHLAFADHSDSNWYAGGGYAWDIVRQNTKVRKQVNEWLGSAALKTPYEIMVNHAVNTEELRNLLKELEDTIDLDEDVIEPDDTILFDESLEQEEHFLDFLIQQKVETIENLVLIDKRSNTAVSHRDVGIGISQVLPVLVASFASQNSLIAMEQPEIHLHPALQAELGDVFIDSALGENGNRILIETHSEHLLLRIMRRMRETYESQLPQGKTPVYPDDVALLYVDPLNTSSIVREMPLNARGELVKAWPGGFFEEGLREIF